MSETTRPPSNASPATRHPAHHRRARRPFAGLRRAVSWHRRKLGALAAVIAVLATIGAVAPGPAPSALVAVTTAGLPGGHVVTDADLRLAEVPLSVLPDDAVTDLAAVRGRALVAPLTRGQVLTTVSVVKPRQEPDEDGLVTAPLRLADEQVVALLAVGDTVDILVADPRTGASTVVATQVRVAAIPATATSSGGLGSMAGSSGSGGRLVLVEVEPGVARALAAAAVNGRLSVVWR